MGDQAVKFRQSDLEVTLNDQQNINNFSKIIVLVKEKDAELRAKKEAFNQIDDAIAEIDLHDDDTIRTKYGDCFFQLSTDFVRENTEEKQATLKSEIKKVEGSLQDSQKKMGKLKANLYAKFGNNINLEEE